MANFSLENLKPCINYYMQLATCVKNQEQSNNRCNLSVSLLNLKGKQYHDKIVIFITVQLILLSCSSEYD